MLFRSRPAAAPIPDWRPAAAAVQEARARPVSYTHLDVYKRQNEDIALQQGGRSRRTVGTPLQGQRNQRYDDQGIKNHSA